MPNLLGTAPNQCPTNGDLGKLAFMDVVDTVTNNPYLDTAISDTKPSLLLDFANSKTLDPRITYTRASTATYYDGKTTAMAEQNLISYSQEFDNAAWTKSDVTITANTTTAPDGTTTADSLVENNATAFHLVGGTNNPIINGAVYILSVYAKAGARSVLQIAPSSSVFGSAYANFNLATGVVSASGGVNSSFIQNVGNGWYRCGVSVTATASSGGTGALNAVLQTSDTAARLATYTGDGTSGIYIWGAQLEQRSAVSSYTPTTSSPITNYIPALQTAAAGVPRFDHDPVTGESKGFLIEEQRTNLLTYSSDFSNAAWDKTGCSIIYNAATSPDGTLTANLIVSSSSVFPIHNYSFTSGVTYTLSVYAKAYAGTSFSLRAQGAVADQDQLCSFNLVNATYTWVQRQSGASATIVPVGNGWYRCSITFTSTATVGGYIGTQSSTGIYIWGAQLEAGAFATSYIPTTTAQVTRSADAASITGTNFSSWYSQGQGTVNCEYTTLQSTGYSGVWELFNSSNNAAFQALQNGTTFAAYSTQGGGVIGAATANYSGAANKTVISFTQQTPSCSVVENSSSVTTGTPSINGFTPNQFRFGTALQGAVSFNKCIKKLAYYPRRLADAELQEMTQ